MKTRIITFLFIAAFSWAAMIYWYLSASRLQIPQRQLIADSQNKNSKWSCELLVVASVSGLKITVFSALHKPHEENSLVFGTETLVPITPGSLIYVCPSAPRRVGPLPH